MQINFAKEKSSLVSIIILYYKDRENIEKCLQSVFRQTHQELQVIVIDNHSSDDFIIKIRHSYPLIEFHTLDYNSGFCKGNNIGLNLSRGEYILFLNSDVILEPNYIETILDVFHKNPKVGIVSGKILRFDKRTIDSAGLFISNRFSLIDRGFSELDKGQYDIGQYVFGCCGAVFFVRSSAVKEISEDYDFFDANFFAFMEDGDVSYRAHLYGYDVWYEPSAVAYHARGASSTGNANIKFFKKPNYYQFLSIRNRYLFLIKNFPINFFLHHLFKFIIIETGIFLYILIHPQLFKVYFSALYYLPSTLQKRKKQRKLIQKIKVFHINEWFLQI